MAIKRVSELRDLFDIQDEIAQAIVAQLKPPANSAATLAAFTLPARTVGGDFHDFLDLDGKRVGIAVADASGKESQRRYSCPWCRLHCGTERDLLTFPPKRC